MNPIISAPYHLGKFNKFLLKQVNISDIYCSISTGLKSHKLCTIQDTPHYKFLSGDTKSYKDYRNMCENFPSLTDDQFPVNYKKFASNYMYLKKPYTTSYLLLKEISRDKYIVLDGVHRASILLFNSMDKIIVGVLN